VFLNLFLNAKDAMPGGGKLRVATMNGRERQRVRFRYRIGHRAGAHSAHLRSVSYHENLASRRTGTRYRTRSFVTYGIIQEHAGKIRVESHPGAGTTFTLDFPLSRKAVHV